MHLCKVVDVSTKMSRHLLKHFECCINAHKIDRYRKAPQMSPTRKFEVINTTMAKIGGSVNMRMIFQVLHHLPTREEKIDPRKICPS